MKSAQTSKELHGVVKVQGSFPFERKQMTNPFVQKYMRRTFLTEGTKYKKKEK